jgi:hypothetical protein
VPEDVSRSGGFFGEDAASVYDERVADMFDPAVVTPVIEMLEAVSTAFAYRSAIVASRLSWGSNWERCRAAAMRRYAFRVNHPLCTSSSRQRLRRSQSAPTATAPVPALSSIAGAM